MQTKKKTYALLLFYFLDETIVVLHFKIYLFLSFLYPRTLYLLSCSLPSLMHLYEDHDDQSLIMIILTTIIIIIKISRSSEILSLWCFIMQMQHCSLKHKEHFLFIWSLKNWTLSQAQLSQTVDWWLHTKPAVPTVAQKADGQTGMLNKHSQSVVSSFYMVLVQCKKIFKTTFLLFNKFIIRGPRVWFRWIAIIIVSLKNSFEKVLFLLTKLLRSAWIKLYVPQIATRWQQKQQSPV